MLSGDFGFRTWFYGFISVLLGGFPYGFRTNCVFTFGCVVCFGVGGLAFVLIRC